MTPHLNDPEDDRAGSIHEIREGVRPMEGVFVHYPRLEQRNDERERSLIKHLLRQGQQQKEK